jgi:cyclopropane fatty-acyl-phospholipid synthase-like methyltransferase
VATISLKKEAERLMKIRGNIKGALLQTHAIFIRKKKGEEGIKKVEEKLRKLGYPLIFNKINPFDWYPEGLNVLILLIIKELFNFTDKEIFEMGNCAPKTSLVAKIFMKHFVSIEKVLKEAPHYWKRYFDFGELEIKEFNQEKKYIDCVVKDYKFHPIKCIFHAGYFLRVAQFVLESKEISIKEIKCYFKGDPYHEYVIKWK